MADEAEPPGERAALLELADAIDAQDRAFDARGLAIWLGAEPTFTRADSLEPPWLWAAEGGDKETRARQLLEALADRIGADVRLCRAVGRVYPDEERARFAFAAQWTRPPRRPLGAELPAPPSCPARAQSVVEPPWHEGAPEAAPPPDPARAVLTVTPDPAVVEVNLAPARDLAEFARYSLCTEAAAREAGLSPTRHRWNGDVTDSGGGGQLTFGGPSPEESPFFLHPRLLPSLLRFFNHHPALSYFFAMECVGGAGQGPRPDEGARERFDELELALLHHEAAADRGQATPEGLFQTFAPLLVDGSGNSHRAEINVEKLWNPHLGARGRLGLVELRALRMEPTPARRVAVASLFRALLGAFAREPFCEPLRDHGAALHDRFALPSILRADLDAALRVLEARAPELAPDPLLRALLREPPAPVAVVESGGARLQISAAREFWPLVGDVASQERSTARLVDSSASRIEVRVDAPASTSPGHLEFQGHALPFAPTPEVEPMAPGALVFLSGLRYRAFAPSPGFHPGLRVDDPLTFVWRRGGEAFEVSLFAWRPEGGPYDGLPHSAAEAERRRRERVRVRRLDDSAAIETLPRLLAPSGVTFDLRRLAARAGPRGGPALL